MTAPNRYPPGWDAASVKALIAHYDAQTEEEEAAEIEAALKGDDVVLVAVPLDLADEVRELIARRKSA
jgi:predicted dinucleotide-binding enzyme